MNYKYFIQYIIKYMDNQSTNNIEFSNTDNNTKKYKKRLWYNNNKEHCQNYNKSYYQKNKDKIKQKRCDRYKKNKEKQILNNQDS